MAGHSAMTVGNIVHVSQDTDLFELVELCLGEGLGMIDQSVMTLWGDRWHSHC